MITVYNGIAGELPNSLNRGFFYGDGAFETMVFKNGRIDFIADHLQRIDEALDVLKIKAGFTEDDISHLVQNLSRQNHLDQLRVKLVVWRKTGGLFEPSEEEGDWLLILSPFSEAPSEKHKVKAVGSIGHRQSLLSQYKVLGCASYVLAGLKKKETGADEVIILDEDKRVSECLYSNIFWIKNGILYTPSLNTGCIAGIIRKQIILYLDNRSIKVEEVAVPLGELLKADFAFTSNSAGCTILRRIEEETFQQENTLYEEIKNFLF